MPSEFPTSQPMVSAAVNGSSAGTSASNATVIEKRVVSRPGARVVETVIVLSDRAARRLQTDGKIPPR